jgi:hypothetical protein
LTTPSSPFGRAGVGIEAFVDHDPPYTRGVVSEAPIAIDDIIKKHLFGPPVARSQCSILLPGYATSVPGLPEADLFQ